MSSAAAVANYCLQQQNAGKFDTALLRGPSGNLGYVAIFCSGVTATNTVTEGIEAICRLTLRK